MCIEALSIQVGSKESIYVYAQPWAPPLAFPCHTREESDNPVRKYRAGKIQNYNSSEVLENKQILPSRKRGNKNCIQGTSCVKSWIYESLSSGIHKKYGMFVICLEHAASYLPGVFRKVMFSSGLNTYRAINTNKNEKYEPNWM